MDKIYILTIGYPSIDPMDDEKITQCTFLKDELGNLMVKGVINPYDYNVIMVKDLRLLIPSPKIFDEVGKYRGILAFSFWPLDVCLKYPKNEYDLYAEELNKIFLMKKFDDLSEKFFSSYSKALKFYLISKNVNGSNIIFKKKHWLGKVFNKYEGHFNYEGCFSPSSYLELILAFSHEKLYDPFAIAPGGLTVGAIVKVGNSTLILHPKPSFGDEDLFREFAREFLNGIKANLLRVKYPQITKPCWVDELYAEDEKRLMDEVKRCVEEYDRKLEDLKLLRDLHWETGENLVKAVELAFKEIGFSVENVSMKGESRDLIIRFNSLQFVVEVKGKEGAADKSDISNFIANNPNENLIFVVNHYRFEDPRERENKKSVYRPYTEAALHAIKTAISKKVIKSFYPITSMDLAKWLYEKLTPNRVLEELNKMAQNYLCV
jgi:hypothetical protein